MFAVVVSDRPNAGVIYESCQSSDGPVIFTGHSRNIWIDFVANKNSSGRGFQMSFLTIEGKKQSGCAKIFFKKVQFMETKIFCVYIIGKNLDNICHILYMYLLCLSKNLYFWKTFLKDSFSIMKYSCTCHSSQCISS